MSKAGLAIAGLAVVGGGLLLMVNHAKAAAAGQVPATGSGGAPVNTVTGSSGTTYQVQMVDAVDSPDGRKLTFEVSDAAGTVLEYMQFQGDDTSRILVLTPDAPHKPHDPMWNNAVSDFGIFTSVPGLT